LGGRWSAVGLSSAVLMPESKRMRTIESSVGFILIAGCL